MSYRGECPTRLPVDPPGAARGRRDHRPIIRGRDGKPLASFRPNGGMPP